MSDRAAFDEFYLGTRLHLLRQLTMMTGDREQAADVLQALVADLAVIEEQRRQPGQPLEVGEAGAVTLLCDRFSCRRPVSPLRCCRPASPTSTRWPAP